LQDSPIYLRTQCSACVQAITCGVGLYLVLRDCVMIAS